MPSQVVGQSVPKKDALEKALGQSRFAADFKLPGMLFAKVLRSPLPHARIRSIDTSGALKLPGVVAVLTHEDVPGANAFGIVLKDEPVLAGEKVRQRGEAVALVAAESAELAVRALRLIRVDYEELPAVFSAREAMLEHSPPIHGASNILTQARIRKGEAEKALEACDVVVTNAYYTQMVEHCYLEPEAGLAYLDGDTVVLRVSTQNVHYDRKDIALNLGIPHNQVRVIQATTGGGFGGKLDISVQCHLALLAWKTKRPVRMVYDREESFLASAKRHPYLIDYTTGATEDGLLKAVKVEIICDTGAYASYGPAVIKRAVVHATGPYEIPNVSIDGYAVYTNNPKAGAMRGFGVPQIAFAHESQLDQVAEKLGMSPFAIRLKNALQAGSFTATQQQLQSSVGIMETLKQARAKAGQLFGGEVK